MTCGSTSVYPSLSLSTQFHCYPPNLGTQPSKSFTNVIAIDSSLCFLSSISIFQSTLHTLLHRYPVLLCYKPSKVLYFSIILTFFSPFHFPPSFYSLTTFPLSTLLLLSNSLHFSLSFSLPVFSLSPSDSPLSFVCSLSFLYSLLSVIFYFLH